MIFEVFKLSDITESDYESYALTMSIGDLIQTSHSSNIQRIRNEEKEKDIMKFIKGNIDNNKSPFFQPFILHYTGKIISTDNKNLLDPQPNYEVEIKDSLGQSTVKLFEFEVIDGNGRLNAMIRLQQLYIDKIHRLNGILKNEDINEKKRKRIEKQIQDLKIKNKTLKDTKLTIQLYLNLDEKQKATLFNSVNQGEKMSKGRLEIYSYSKPENELLQSYIVHTSSIADFPYKITVDKDAIRSIKERDEFIPSIYLIPTLKKIVKYYKGKDISEYKEDAFKVLDAYITGLSNSKMLRKQYFSILGSVIDTASEYSEELSVFTSKMSKFNYSEYPDVSKQQKLVKNAILNFVFEGADKKSINLNNSKYLESSQDNKENDDLARQEIAMTDN